MGDHSKNLILLISAAVLSALLSTVAASGKERDMSEAAESYIRSIAAGEGFSSPPSRIMDRGQPSPVAVERLRLELTRADAVVREGIVDLLVDLGFQTDPLVHQGIPVLRQPELIAILVTEGCMFADAACLAAMDAVRVAAPIGLLKSHNHRFVELLERQSSDTLLYTIAKAKAFDARPIVEAQNGEAVDITKAALGNQGIEDALIDAIRTAETGEKLAAAVANAGLAGTNQILVTIGEQMRTPLVIDRPGIEIASVRLAVLDALRYNFPHVPEFHELNIRTDEDYIRVEEILQRDFGVVFKEPRPEFLTIINYPSSLAPVE